MTGCKPTEYITVPEYHERLVHSHDTVHQRDSFISNTTTTIREVDSAALAKLGIQISGMKSAYLVEIDRLRQEMSSLQGRDPTRYWSTTLCLSSRWYLRSSTHGSGRR